ncbi:RNA polymerase sigma factor [Runella slithyformis]|uniref:RNA polymerase, sigma-24 subunit, ECF subfamily n=1 Tax=Runella slithyformis (strain ATCC 29530 / DSM 19594 / LMG 11500 / NCIMB 11436 / LSU 4) TaxID=761193 RepID=A0A7U3ZHX8_RUNSL|nr:sigma-70 family RNA polymerase sigma factor [Runella slithyformis]AEI47547.1 RNA polymerase, sigma-24 subunit, ECF subfamily [Runella slithyformis DSM 19594]
MFLKVFRRKATLTDAEYLSDYRRTGDLTGLGELYERHMDMVFAVCFQYLREEDEAKDAVMQVFEQLITDLKTYEVQHFKSWLHSVARNYCLMQLRKKRVSVGDEGLFEQEAYENVVAEPPEKEDWEIEHQLNDLGDCLQTLANEQRRSIELFYFQQLCYQQIAEQTGFAITKVKSYLQNGKRNLKLCMEGKQHG